jgi:D-amino peptidase
MKVFVSADIEGIAGVTRREEVDPANPACEAWQRRMSDHVAAACEGALEAGAAEVLVRDAHWNSDNIDPASLPRPARLLRGWSGDPLFMLEGLDPSFDAALFVGYHARAGSGGSPLAHTLSGSKVALMEVNGRPVAEHHLNVWAAATVSVPVVMISGDEAVCEDARALAPSIVTIPVMRGAGASTESLHPDEARDRIRTGAETALRSDPSACAVELPDRWRLAITYHQPADAYRKSFYPGASRLDDRTVEFYADNYREIMRSLMFIVY